MSRKRLGVKDKDSDMAQSVRQVAATDEHAGAGRFEEILLDSISGNDRNPRFRAVTPTEVAELRRAAQTAFAERSSEGIDDRFFDTVGELIDQQELGASDQLTADECRARLHGILGLARSINRVNLIQPITVYPHDTGYEVLAGQRRYLAHVLLGRREIRAIIRQPSGDRLSDSLAAVVENLAREELSLRERVEAIEEIVNLHEESNGAMTGSALQEYLGESKRTCQRYLRILRESAVREGIRTGDVTSLRQAAQMVDPGRMGGDDPEPEADRGKLTRAAPVEHDRASSESSGTGAGSRKKRAARPKIRVQLGTVYSCDQVYRLMSGFLGPERLAADYPDIDWSDFGEVEKTWKSFWAEHIATGSDE